MLSQLYKVFYSRWDRPPARPTPGYTLWILMPGDLPFFFDIFLAVFAGKATEHLVETVVVADMTSPGLERRFAAFAAKWPHGPIRLVRLRPLDRMLVKAMRHPHIMCWLQLVNAINATKTTHGLWHDADLFLLDPEFFDAHYRECVDKKLAFLGLSPVWDEWFAEIGMPYINATWEMMFEVARLRDFRPWEHRGHNARIKGEVHGVDITLKAQAETPADRVGRRGQSPDFIHFNYVMGSYRPFQNARGSYEDDYFRVLLIRLLIDAFDTAGDAWPYDAPSTEELARGIADPSARVTYVAPETAGHYEEFRTKLQRLIDSPILDAGQSGRIARGVERFDEAFGRPSAVPGLAVGG